MPIPVNIPNRLILQEGGEVKRAESETIALDERTNRYLAPLSSYLSLAAAAVGTADADFPGLECVSYTCRQGKVMGEVELLFKGLTRAPDPAFPVNDVTLQTSQVQDQDGTSVMVMYYSPQTTWHWIATTRPASATYSGVMSANFEITPILTQPYAYLSSLQYKLIQEVTHFHTEPVANYWICESTTAIVMQPEDNDQPIING